VTDEHQDTQLFRFPKRVDQVEESGPQHRSSDQPVRLGRRAASVSLGSLPGIGLALSSAGGLLLAMAYEHLVPSPVSWYPWIGALVVCGGIGWWSRHPGIMRCGVYASVIAGMGVYWLGVSSPRTPVELPGLRTTRMPAVIRARVASPVQLRPHPMASFGARADVPEIQSIVDLAVEAIRDQQTWKQARGRIRTTIDGAVDPLLVGDMILVHGMVSIPGPPTNPGAADIRAYYRDEGIAALCSVQHPSDIVTLAAGPWSLGRLLSWLSVEGEKALLRSVGDDAGPLASALVLGRRLGVAPAAQQRLLETGTIHLLSVSGLHLGLAAMIVSYGVLLCGWRRSTQIIVVLAFCVFYAALTGARPPVLRAAILVAALLLASWTGRQPQVLNSLGLAAFVLLVLNPRNLLLTGTQLSFLAVATIFLAGRLRIVEDDPADGLQRLLEKTQSRWRTRVQRAIRSLRSAVGMSFWVWAISTPLVWHVFHVLSPISVFANVLLGLPLAIALILGLLTATVGIASSIVVAPAGYGCALCLQVMSGFIAVCGEIPGGHFWLPAPPGWWVLTFYTVLSAILFVPQGWRKRKRTPWLAGRAALVWGVLWSLAAFWLGTHPHDPTEPDDGALVLTFIDVGHGTSVLIELPEDRGVWLYDAGKLGAAHWSATPIQEVLWNRGYARIDGLLVSHADADHYNAVPDLVDRFWFGQFLCAPGFLEDPQFDFFPLTEHVAAEVPESVLVAEGTSLRDRAGAVWAECLHPPTQRVAGSDNANSIVLTLEFGGRTVVLPGDLESPGTEALIQHRRPRGGGIMMAPHHGSTQEDPRWILDWARPWFVIVSGGPRADRPVVQEMLSQYGAEVLTTAALGAIRCTIDPQGAVQIDHWNVDHWERLAEDSPWSPSNRSPNLETEIP